MPVQSSLRLIHQSETKSKVFACCSFSHCICSNSAASTFGAPFPLCACQLCERLCWTVAGQPGDPLLIYYICAHPSLILRASSQKLHDDTSQKCCLASPCPANAWPICPASCKKSHACMQYPECGCGLQIGQNAWMSVWADATEAAGARGEKLKNTMYLIVYFSLGIGAMGLTVGFHS